VIQTHLVRCPGHTIQFSGYSEYIKKTKEILGIKITNLDWRK
jgi:hypothetical protein